MPVGTEAQNRDVETAAGRDHAFNARGVALGVRGQRLEANEAIHPDLERIEKSALQPGCEQSMVGLGEAQVLVELCHLETGERGAMAVREFSKHAFGCGAYRKCGKRGRSGRCADVTNGDGSPAAEIRVIGRPQRPDSSPVSRAARRIENEALRHRPLRTTRRRSRGRCPECGNSRGNACGVPVRLPIGNGSPRFVIPPVRIATSKSSRAWAFAIAAPSMSWTVSTSRSRIAVPVRRGTQVIFQSAAGSPANGSRSGEILQVDPRRRPLGAGVGNPCETQLTAQVVTAFVDAAADQEAAADAPIPP